MYREMLFQSVNGLIEPLLTSQGFDLAELQLQQHNGRWLVRVFADREEGVTLEACRRLSIDIGHLLDIEELLPASYILEVSSPGLDRPLRTERDFRRQCQRMVTLFLHSPWQDRTQYTGRIARVADSYLVLHRPPDVPFEIPLTQIDHGIVELEFK
jgi:ribosome maturation factor RimP